jgi:hypothetical protein
LRPGTYPTGGHRDAPGASTACPGNRLYARLGDVHARIDQLLAAPSPLETAEVSPMDYVGQQPTPQGDGAWILLADGAVHTAGNAAYIGGANLHMGPNDRATSIGPHPDGVYGFRVLTVQSPTVGFAYAGQPRPPVNQPAPCPTIDPQLVARAASDRQALLDIAARAGQALS